LTTRKRHQRGLKTLRRSSHRQTHHDRSRRLQSDTQYIRSSLLIRRGHEDESLRARSSHTCNTSGTYLSIIMRREGGGRKYRHSYIQTHIGAISRD
jgi:hypothetical protein